MPQLGEIRKGKEIWGARGTSVDRHKWVWDDCQVCGRERWVFLYRGTARSVKCRPCSDKIHGRRLADMPHKSMLQINHRAIMKSGYATIVLSHQDYFKPMAQDNHILEHRLVMAKHLGRLLDTPEIVHHLNGIRDDNRKENLILTDSRKHEGHTYAKLLQARIRELEQGCKLCVSKSPL